MPRQFTGDGFSQEPITGAEAAQMRELFKTLDENFVHLSSETHDYMKSIATLIAAWVIGVRVLKFGAPLAFFIAALTYYAKLAGLL